MAEFKYEIITTFGDLSGEKSWKKELNLIKWNDREAKYDLREWSPGRAKMGKGITLSKDELIALRALLQSMDL